MMAEANQARIIIMIIIVSYFKPAPPEAELHNYKNPGPPRETEESIYYMYIIEGTHMKWCAIVCIGACMM